ncbi:hypothetical protein Z517_09316 [Fonsecaea pedrosoi CBS 271.37]|uniref:Uncharacterized protein n=1 Tax=Fonsecaea pedrosoi CBS 271.37 TaxID=1442368 RepID=A0A0D2ERJ0_9EURO|nr:uncharacterized protein Z517_09316 [Fonsecaea pedrosoi CBS 271.37]KIW76872.1 hypothetical protein Z517_09316 [Fonsecaea pedrosoi CBS 271.37]
MTIELAPFPSTKDSVAKRYSRAPKSVAELDTPRYCSTPRRAYMIIQLGTITTLSAHPDTLLLVITLDRISTIVITPENMFAIVYSTMWMHMYLSMFRQTVWCPSLTAIPFLLMSTSLSVYVNQCVSATSLIFMSMITSGLHIKFTYEYRAFSLSTALKMDGNTSPAMLMTGYSDVLSPPLEMVARPINLAITQHDPGLGHDDGIEGVLVHAVVHASEAVTERAGVKIPPAPLFDAESASALDVQTSTAPVHNATTVGQYQIYQTVYRTNCTILAVAPSYRSTESCLNRAALYWVRRAAHERIDAGSKLDKAGSSAAMRFLRILSFFLCSFSSAVFPHQAVPQEWNLGCAENHWKNEDWDKKQEDADKLKHGHWIRSRRERLARRGLRTKYDGYWLLGRKISLSPFEVAEALHYSAVVDERTGTRVPYSVLDVDDGERPDQVPQSGLNLSADEPVKVPGSYKVCYGEIAPNILGLALVEYTDTANAGRLYDRFSELDMVCTVRSCRIPLQHKVHEAVCRLSCILARVGLQEKEKGIRGNGLRA